MRGRTVPRTSSSRVYFGRVPEEFYNFTRLEPAYRVFEPGRERAVDVPGTWAGMLGFVQSLSPGSAGGFRYLMGQAKQRHEIEMGPFLAYARRVFDRLKSQRPRRFVFSCSL